MKPLRRQPVNKHKSAGKFRHQVRKTKAANIGWARGGIRL